MTEATANEVERQLHVQMLEQALWPMSSKTESEQSESLTAGV